MLQLPGRKTVADLPPLTAAPGKAPAVQPKESKVSGELSSPAHATETPAEEEHNIQHAAAQPDFIVSGAADVKTSTHQDTSALNTAEPDEASPPAAATIAGQQGAMQALDMLFPQELQRTPSVPHDTPQCGTQPVHTAAAPGLLQRPVANPDVQVTILQTNAIRTHGQQLACHACSSAEIRAQLVLQGCDIALHRPVAAA